MSLLHTCDFELSSSFCWCACAAAVAGERCSACACRRSSNSFRWRAFMYRFSDVGSSSVSRSPVSTCNGAKKCISAYEL